MEPPGIHQQRPGCRVVDVGLHTPSSLGFDGIRATYPDMLKNFGLIIIYKPGIEWLLRGQVNCGAGNPCYCGERYNGILSTVAHMSEW